MAIVIEGRGKKYLFTFSLPESDWITDIAKSLGISKEAVVGAAMNKGLIHYHETFVKSDTVESGKGHAEEKSDTG